MNSRLLHVGAAVSFSAMSLLLSAPAFSVAPAATETNVEQPKLAEVVVTATKRVEREVTVPISLSVLGGAQLDESSLQNATQALSLVPGVAINLNGQGGEPVLTVRGVTASGALFSGPSPIGYYLDYIPFGLVRSAVEPDPDIYDLDRIEVLRGPQGTLYGASALNGVVRVLTNDADLDEFEVKGRIGTSTTEHGGGNWLGDGAINIPVVPGALAARLVVSSSDNSGWINTPLRTHVNDENSKNIRLKVSAKLREDLTIKLEAMHQQTDLGAPPLATADFSASTRNQAITTHWNGYDVHVDYEPPTVFSVSSSTSYFTYVNNGSLDLEPGDSSIPPLTTLLNSRVFSEELNLLSNLTGPWQWSTGVFYRDARDSFYQTLGDLIPAPVDEADTSRSEAVFGQLSRFFLEKQLELSLGARYFHDEVGLSQLILFGEPPGTPLLRSETPFNSTTPRVVLSWFPDWIPNHNEMMYASYSQGFRSGYPQSELVQVVNTSFPPVKPDKLSNYEIGSKGELLDGRLSYNAAVYYMKWEGIQESLGIVLPPSTAAIVVNVNGKSASGAGVDFGATVRPVDPLALGVNFSWNGLHEDDSVYSGGSLLFPVGARIDSSPEYTAGVTAQYDFPLGSHGWTGNFGLIGRYTSEQTTTSTSTTSALPIVLESSVITTADVSFSVNSPTHWRWMLYCNNVGDNDRIPLASMTPYENLSIRPRTIGLQLNYDFKEYK
jgi:outer membrane receptor protein involved in Fe transport